MMKFIGAVDTPTVVFATIELCAFSCAVLAALNTNPDHRNARSEAMTKIFPRQEVFTKRGWMFRKWAFRIQVLAVFWVMVSYFLLRFG